MRHPYNIFTVFFAAIAMMACTTAETPVESKEHGPEVQNVIASLGNSVVGEVNTKGTTWTWVVNTSADPTFTSGLKERGEAGWQMNMQIYKGDKPYSHGQGVCVWDSSKDVFGMPSETIHFPNYTKQKIDFKLIPARGTVVPVILKVQDTAGELLAQDILINNPDSFYNPAHDIVVNMKHAHSMINFAFEDQPEDISKVEVQLGDEADLYKPYKVNDQYLLILPAGEEKNMIIVVTTNKSTVYKQTVKMSEAFAINTCYQFKLKGLELLLSPIVVTNWTTGEAVPGDYVAVTSYPTFRGPANSSCELYYDNKLVDNESKEIWQKLTFNSRGECTVKPFGRTITHVKVGIKENKLSTPLILREMIIDLNEIIAACK